MELEQASLWQELSVMNQLYVEQVFLLNKHKKQTSYKDIKKTKWKQILITT